RPAGLVSVFVREDRRVRADRSRVEEQRTQPDEAEPSLARDAREEIERDCSDRDDPGEQPRSHLVARWKVLAEEANLERREHDTAEANIRDPPLDRATVRHARSS